MRQMQVWSPLSDLWDLQSEINDLFRGFNRGQRRPGEDARADTPLWSPAVDVCEDREGIKLTAELPGMRREEVKISVEDGVITLKGERRFTEERKKENFYRIERSYGAFSRSFTLPQTVEPDKIKATMRDGVLEVLIPKKEDAKPKEISIEVK